MMDDLPKLFLCFYVFISLKYLCWWAGHWAALSDQWVIIFILVVVALSPFYTRLIILTDLVRDRNTGSWGNIKSRKGTLIGLKKL